MSELKISFKKREPVQVYSITGRKVVNEDSYCLTPVIENRQLLFVADGVGGHGHGDFASQKCVEIFKHSFENLPENTIIPDYLRKTAIHVAQAVLQKGIDEPEFKNCGTTLSGFFRDNNEYYIINIGDSRVYHYSTNLLRRLTRDQSKIQDLIDAGIITEEESRTHPERTIMTSAIGQPLEMMKIDIDGPFPIEKGEMLLAFSDGVHDALHDSEIKQVIESNITSDEMAKKLVESAFETGIKDNITAILYKH